MKKKIIFIMPSFTNYRKFVYDFLEKKNYSFKIFFCKLGSNLEGLIQSNFIIDNKTYINLKHYNFFGLVYFNFFKILIHIKSSEYIVLNDNPRNISNYFIILVNIFFKKKIIMWGHTESLRFKYKKRSKLSIVYFLRKIYVKFCFRYLVYHKKCKEILVNNYDIDKNKVYILNNTLEICNLKTINKFQFVDKKKISVCFLGRLTIAKGINTYIKLAEQVSKTDHPIHFYAIGKIGTEKISNDLKASKSINYLGFYTDLYKISEIIHKFDAVVVPGFVGLVVNHSLSVGCPIITYPDEFENKIFHSFEFFYLKKNKTVFYSDFSIESFIQIINKIKNNRKEIFYNCQNSTNSFLASNFLSQFEKVFT